MRQEIKKADSKYIKFRNRVESFLIGAVGAILIVSVASQCGGTTQRPAMADGHYDRYVPLQSVEIPQRSDPGPIPQEYVEKARELKQERLRQVSEEVQAQQVWIRETPNYTDEDLRCLAANIYYESRGESRAGRMGVGIVTLNRVNHGNWPGSVCEVVKQPYQFSWMNAKDFVYPQPDNPIDARALEEIEQMASFLLDGGYSSVDHPAHDAYHFYNPNLVSWEFDNDYNVIAEIGNHRFLS